MMLSMLYHPQDIATIIKTRDMSVKKSSNLIERIWQEEKEYLLPIHRYNYKRFKLDIMNCVNYMDNQKSFEVEFPQINRDLAELGCQSLIQNNTFIDENFDTFFINQRIRILFLDEQGYTKMKLRTLLSKYGYKRRTKDLMAYIRNCMFFYHIEAYTRGGILCDIETIELDDMIIFRTL